MKSFVGNIIFLAALLLIMARFLSVWSGTAFPIDLVTAHSMNPSLMEGDIVAWTPAMIEDIEIGDVIVFKSYIRWPDEKIVVHRVIGIKTDKTTGEPMLETKGDANEWTDQAGPHIPEPYIREDHLMGKTISIGKQPLKIPFIGYIGIWVNQGLELLAQSTVAKGTLTYAGVFAPLTISAVLLVILIFVLPEKTKTVKEKLRLYIFGPRPVSLKKTLMLFLVLYIVFLLIIHCFAYDSTTASLGVEKNSPKSAISFGRVKQGTTSPSIELPIINPSVMPVKGVIFGRGEIGEYVSKKTFELKPGGYEGIPLTATVLNGTQNGSYLGDIMIYSSPFWLIFPDDFIQHLNNWNAEATIYCLDILSALVLTFITVSLLAAVTFVADKYTILVTDRSWRHASKLILKRETRKRVILAKKTMKQTLSRRIGWISKLDLAETDRNEKHLTSLIKPVLASVVIIPLLFLISDQILAMIVAAITAGLVAYFISCKLRRKVILATILATSIIVVHMMIDSNMILIAKEHTMLELISLGLGAMGVYLLLLAIFLIPLSLLSWFLASLIRNLKERKDPLLVLEGSCDL
jgi:signal peptidase